jgi:hypothetical protein
MAPRNLLSRRNRTARRLWARRLRLTGDAGVRRSALVGLRHGRLVGRCPARGLRLLASVVHVGIRLFVLCARAHGARRRPTAPLALWPLASCSAAVVPAQGGGASKWRSARPRASRPRLCPPPSGGALHLSTSSSEHRGGAALMRAVGKRRSTRLRWRCRVHDCHSQGGKKRPVLRRPQPPECG